MTDHPRFKLYMGNADDAYRQYHGGRLVGFVLRIADHLRARRFTGSIDAMSAVSMLKHLKNNESACLQQPQEPKTDDPITSYDRALLASFESRRKTVEAALGGKRRVVALVLIALILGATAVTMGLPTTPRPFEPFPSVLTDEGGATRSP